MSTEPEQPAYQNYPAMPAARPAPVVPVKPGVNGFAVASFVTGIFGIIGGAIFSVVFGIIALVGIGRTRQRGKGFAIAGIVLSGLWTVVLVVFFVSGVLQGIRVAPARTAADASYNFQVGQCFDRPQTSQSAPSTPLDCAKSHFAEVFAVEPLPGNDYPGKDAVEAIGHTKCPADAGRFLTPGLNYPDVTTAFLYPLDTSWARGDRGVKCFFHRIDGLPMTGHVKDSGTPYTADQKLYLEAVEPYYKIAGEQDAATSWTAKRDVCAQAVPVLEKEISALQARPWPGNAQSLVTILINVKQMELGDRRRAAAATDEGSLEHALDTARTHDVDSDGTDGTIRTALHLPPR
jgi:hypothetical protein